MSFQIVNDQNIAKHLGLDQILWTNLVPIGRMNLDSSSNFGTEFVECIAKLNQVYQVEHLGNDEPKNGTNYN